jgi:hemerythrin superfamily protein
MLSTTPASALRRAPRSARARTLRQLRADHQRVEHAYRSFRGLDPDLDRETCLAIVQRVLSELAAHAQLEEGLLYPAARDAIADPALIDEAEIEHESINGFVEQLRTMDPDDAKFAARFTVLCEYVLHHVKHEEGQIFPELELAVLDWDRLADAMDQRRRELSSSAGLAAASELMP